jgi:hypothetical protein
MVAAPGKGDMEFFEEALGTHGGVIFIEMHNLSL